MIFIAKDVADGIASWAKRPEVESMAEAIRNMPGADVYARSVAGGMKDGPATPPEPGAASDSPAVDRRGASLAAGKSAKAVVKPERRSR